MPRSSSSINILGARVILMTLEQLPLIFYYMLLYGALLYYMGFYGSFVLFSYLLQRIEYIQYAKVKIY